MGSRRGRLLAAAGVLAAVFTSAAPGASLRVLIAHTPNRTDSNRTAKTIEAIVIHSTEGRFVGSVRYLEHARSHGSAHFVVSRRGQVVELVPVTDVAWHSGNGWWNLHSIGIEHEGWVDRKSFTEAQYRASAKLVAYLAHRWGIPLDRRHIIGHNEVPNPIWPGHFGGIDGHTDPGPYWRWRHYLSLVRWYARHPELPSFVRRMTLVDSPVPPRVHGAAGAAPPRSVVDQGASIRGSALWWSGIDAAHRWRRHIWKVDFIVDGRTLYTDHTWPFAFHRHAGWDTRTVPNGRHLLQVRAYGAHHYRARKQIHVRVVNPPLRVRVIGAVSGGAVSGDLVLGVQVNDQVERVVLYADGKPVSRDGSAPYRVTWNTAGESEGAHTLLVYAKGLHGHRAALVLPLLVANAPTFPQALARNWVTHHGFEFDVPEQ
jgi:N-acetyl-anhydromuramyl-L-alanine amidase AmpD